MRNQPQTPTPTAVSNDTLQILRDAGQGEVADALMPQPEPKPPMPFTDGLRGTLGDIASSAVGGLTTAVEDLGEIATNVADFLVDKTLGGPFEYLTGHKIDFFDDNPNYAGMLTPDNLKPRTQLGLMAQSMVNFGTRILAMNIVGAGLAKEFPEALDIVTSMFSRTPEALNIPDLGTFAAPVGLLDATRTAVPLVTRADLGLAGEGFMRTETAPVGPLLSTNTTGPMSTAQSLLNKTLDGVITGALGDFTKHPKETLIDPDDPLINQPWYKETLAELFNSDPDDPQTVKRAKNMLAWVVPNAVTSFLMAGLSEWRQLRKAKSEAERLQIAKVIRDRTESIKNAEHAVPDVDREQITKDTVKAFKDKVDKGYKINRGELSPPRTRLTPDDLAAPASKTVKHLDWAVRFRENARNLKYGDEEVKRLATEDGNNLVTSMAQANPDTRNLIRAMGFEGRTAGLELTESEINLATVIHKKLTPDLIAAYNRFHDLTRVKGADLTDAYNNLIDHITVMVEGQEELLGVGGWAGRALRVMRELGKLGNSDIDLSNFVTTIPDHDTLRQTIMKNFPANMIDDLGAAFTGAVDTYNDGRAVSWLASTVKNAINGKGTPMTFKEMMLDMEKSWTYMSMLSGPATHTANTVGNVIKVFVTDPMDLYFSRLAPTINPLATGDHWNLSEANEATAAYYGGLFRGFKTGLRTMRAAWKYDTSILSPQTGMKFDNGETFKYNPLFGGPDGNLLKKIVDAPGSLLNMEDELFKQAAYRGQIELQIHDFMKTAEAQAILGANPSANTLREFKDAIVDKYYGSLFIDKDNAIKGATATGFRDATGILDANKALEGALQSTWNNTPQNDAAFQAIKWIRNIPGGHHLMPFTKTVYNIGHDALIDHNPLGIIRLLTNPMVQASPELQAKVIGQFNTSLFLWGGTYLLYRGGYITGGGPTNRTARQLWLEEGNVPYSFMGVGIGNLDPIAAPLVMLADTFDHAEEITPSTGQQNGAVAAGFNALVDYATNRTWLRSVGDLFRVLDQDPKTAGEGILRYIRQNLSGAYIPSFFATTRRIIDPYTRETRDTDAPFTNRLPILDDEITPPKVSWLTGELIRSRYGDSIGERALNATTFIRKHDREESDIVFDNMVKSNVERQPSHKLRCGVTLNDEDYARYCRLIGTTKLFGKTLYQTLESKFKTRAWEAQYGIDPTDKSLSRKKETWITKQVNRYKKAAEQQFLRENPNAMHWMKEHTRQQKLYQAGRIQQIDEEFITYDSSKDYLSIIRNH